jgi:glycosyltransferase involved in cell wall biosynthesis
VRLLRQEHRGVSAARNLAIREARSDFLALLDADDMWDPAKIATCLPRLLEDAHLAAVFHRYRILNTRTAEAWPSDDAPVPWSDPGALLLSLNRRNVHVSTAVLRRRCVEEVGGFDEDIRIGEDWDLWLRLAERFGSVCLDETLATVRHHGRNVSATRLADWADNNRRTLDKALARRPSFYAPVRRKALAAFHFWAGFYAYALRDMPRARKELWRSLAWRPSARAANYLLRSLLGARTVERVRAMVGRG